MKRLSLYQPHASLIAWGEKQTETRSWGTDYRGPVAIHATATEPASWRQRAWENHRISAAMRRHLPDLRHTASAIDQAVQQLPHSAIVAVADIEDVFEVDGRGTSGQGWHLLYHRDGQVQGYTVSDDEAAFGDHSVGRYVWRMGNVRVLATPVTCRGGQGLRDLSPYLIEQVNAELAKGKELVTYGTDN